MDFEGNGGKAFQFCLISWLVRVSKPFTTLLMVSAESFLFSPQCTSLILSFKLRVILPNVFLIGLTLCLLKLVGFLQVAGLGAQTALRDCGMPPWRNVGVERVPWAIESSPLGS